MLTFLADWVGRAAFFAVFAGVALTLDDDWLTYDKNRLEQVSLMVMAGGALLAAPAVFSRLWGELPRWALLAAAAFFGLGALAAARALEPRWGALEWANFLLLFAGGLLLARLLIDDWRTVSRGLVWLLAAVAAVVIVKVMVGYGAALVERVRLDTVLLFEGTFSNRRFFGQLATLLIPLLAWMTWCAKRFRVGWLALLSAWWMLVFVSGTRGSWLALALAHGGALLALRRGVWPFMRVQALGLGLGLAAYAVLFYGVPALLGLEAGVENRFDKHFAHLSARETLWALAWQYAVTNPWFGIGPMHFAAFPNEVGAHPHNALLQLAAEWGFPAMLAAAAVAVGGVVAFAKPLWREVDPLRLALLVSLLGAGVQAMVDGMIVIPYTQTWLALVAGWALGLHFKERVLPEKPAGTMALIGVRVVALLALGALAWGVWPEILNRPEATAAYLERHDSLSPRYWAQGWIR